MGISRLTGAPPVTLADLLAHTKRYGLDIDAKATHRFTPKYTAWKSLEKDAAVEVAIEGLGIEAFTLFIEGIGYHQFRDQARAAWRDIRGIDDDDAVQA